ncbi:5-formyltetrahydrofolate cyclo-ligase [Reinekea marinisedimentorum]|uniref:5-formyltetrahydrofolate cyclo-ligase n=1 Tax=Reinekea marinisedimentorum TaxID=230495 RepID=A0A4R3IFJ5_9GAMM|nr:5-formyltetrahydrofolate cyclo-ligase [Reinekea marinisedimentorum]TCS43742.1 5-formyltetrahydrofolate cyclo-ligase [Reinekea marinisedimentorum]
MDIASQKSQMRTFLRRTRRNLSPEQQQDAAYRLSQVIRQHVGQQRNVKIALYHANDGEIDLSFFIEQCHKRDFELYMPVIHSFKPTLWFARYSPGSAMYSNRFGIPEPLHGEPIAPWQLNLVLLPLVGFDTAGGRLGMGGGFYDRTFAHQRRWPKKPKLFGVAHECQKVESIPVEAWDIPLAGVFTDKQAYLSRQKP